MKFRWLVALVCACSMPAPERPTSLVAMQSLPGIWVGIGPSGVAGFLVRVDNRRTTQVDLDWDESSFVDARGISWGRLLRGETRVIDSAKPQSKTPIAPGSTMIEWFVPEELAGYNGNTTNWRTAPDPLKAASSAAPAVMTGSGRLYLVFESPGGPPETWIGRLVFGSATPAASTAPTTASPVTPAGTPPASSPSTAPTGSP